MAVTREPYAITQGELLTAADADIGSAVPTGRRFIPRRIRLFNTDTVDRDVSLWVIPSGQSKGDAYALISAETVVTKQGLIVSLPEGEIWYPGTVLHGSATSASVVNIVVGGILIAGPFS